MGTVFATKVSVSSTIGVSVFDLVVMVDSSTGVNSLVARSFPVSLVSSVVRLNS